MARPKLACDQQAHCSVACGDHLNALSGRFPAQDRRQRLIHHLYLSVIETMFHG